jgi:hypothetical protein
MFLEHAPATHDVAGLGAAGCVESTTVILRLLENANLLSGQSPVPDQIDGAGEPGNAAPDDLGFSFARLIHERPPGDWFDVPKPKVN